MRSLPLLLPLIGIAVVFTAPAIVSATPKGYLFVLSALGLIALFYITIFIVHTNKEYRNPVVIRRKFEHPGWEEVNILATKEELLSLAARISAQSEKPQVEVAQVASVEKEKTGYTRLVFRSVSPEELEAAQSTPNLTRVGGIGLQICFIAVLALAAYGGYCLVR